MKLEVQYAYSLPFYSTFPKGQPWLKLDMVDEERKCFCWLEDVEQSPRVNFIEFMKASAWNNNSRLYPVIVYPVIDIALILFPFSAT